MSQKPLPVNEVHVWCADPAQLTPVPAYTAALEIVTTEERSRLERFRFRRDRVTFLATRVLVRTVLSHYVPRTPHAWRFAINEYGRPRIADNNHSGLCFNLSKTRGLVVCALTRDTEIGVDVEKLESAPMLGIAEEFFSPIEISTLRALPPDEQARRFYDYWTLKESYIKARGLGLEIPLNRFAFILECDRPPRIEIDHEFRDTADSWQFLQLHPTTTHLVALCVRRKSRNDAQAVMCWLDLAPQSRHLRL